MEKTEKSAQQVRRETLARRNAMDPEKRRRKSEQILSHLFLLSEFNTAGVLFIYVHFRSEVQTVALLETILKQNRTVCVPQTVVDPPSLRAVRITDLKQQLVPGYSSILEPTKEWAAVNMFDPQRINVVIVPGSVFDLQGGRLGYGGGFYDRFLAVDAPQATRIGLAFDEQVVEKLPLEPHDQRMDILVTEKGIFQCRKKKL